MKPTVSTGNFPDKSVDNGHVLMCALCRAGRIFTHNELKIRHSQKFNYHVFIYKVHIEPKVQTKQKK